MQKLIAVIVFVVVYSMLEFWIGPIVKGFLCAEVLLCK